MGQLSKSQVDRLGERLREGSHSENDLRLLDDYRASFGAAYESVLQTIRGRSQFPTGRISKSTPSIVAKLRRQPIKLSRMQDVAGCRVVIANILQQDQLVAVLQNDFPNASVVDRRDKPSFGYRAVHIIAEVSGKRVEIQVRSLLQHLWAELSEKSSDVVDPTIKYGGGQELLRIFLSESSESVASCENFEKLHFKAESSQKKPLAAHAHFKKTIEYLNHHVPEKANEIQALREKLEESARKGLYLEENVEKQRVQLDNLRKHNMRLLSGVISSLDKPKEQWQ